MGLEDLVAICGLYCGACEIYRADHDHNEEKRQDFFQRFTIKHQNIPPEALHCDGCLGHGRITPWCQQCAFRECTSTKQGVTRCSDCSQFPCSRITNFNHDGSLHHGEVLKNLGRIREIGIKNWVKNEEERWHCPQCQAYLAWYDKSCLNCASERPERLFPLKRDQL